MDSDSYYQPRESDWDRYEQKMEEIILAIWDMSVADFYEEVPLNGHSKDIYLAVQALAQRILEEYVEGKADYEADREYQARKEGDRDERTQGG